MSVEPSGLERVFFPVHSRAQIDGWVRSVVHRQLGRRTRALVFRSGRIDSVYGVQLVDGESVVLRLYRPPVDIGALTARVEAMRLLADSGYPCPLPLAAPFSTDGRVGAIETLLTQGGDGDVRQPRVRRAFVSSLLQHIDLLRDQPAIARRLVTRPAWTEYRGGPWPRPHDSIFDFSTTPTGWEWMNAVAQRATAEIATLRERRADLGGQVIGHGDWYAGNVRFSDSRVVAAFDWDLIVEDEAVLVGLSAGGFTTDGAPSPQDVSGFIGDASALRGGFSGEQMRAASAAARWVLAFNARCQLSNLGNRADLTAAEIEQASYLQRLYDERDALEQIS